MPAAWAETTGSVHWDSVCVDVEIDCCSVVVVAELAAVSVAELAV